MKYDINNNAKKNKLKPKSKSSSIHLHILHWRSRILIIISVIYSTRTHTIIQYLLPSSGPSYYLLNTSNYLAFTLAILSLFQCMRIPTHIPSDIAAPKVKLHLTNNVPFYTQINHCEKEAQRYKPPRTSHCHKDGCVARFVIND